MIAKIIEIGVITNHCASDSDIVLFYICASSPGEVFSVSEVIAYYWW